MAVSDVAMSARPLEPTAVDCRRVSVSGCPSEETLVRWAAGACRVDDVATLAAHVDGCEACRAGFSAALAALRIDDTVARPSLLGPTAPVAIGQVLLRKYQVLDVLGSGGMGVVFRARHLQLNHEVALKFIRGEHLHRADVRSRFMREARSAAALRSEHVNRVLDLGELEDGTPFMALELLTGQTLEARLAERGPLPEAEVIRWVRQACVGLEAAHAAGIVHRDLKPANLFLRREGDTETLTILDFGVARSINPLIEAGLKQTTTPSLVGSPAFMAPEQLSANADVGPLVDLWAMGCTLQMLLTGQLPFRADDVIDLAWRVRNAAPTALPSTVSARLQAIVARCLEKSPSARFPSAAALRAALEGVSTSVASLEAQVKPVARWPVVALVSAALALVMGWAARRGPAAPADGAAPTARRLAPVTPTPPAVDAPTPAAASTSLRADERPPAVVTTPLPAALAPRPVADADRVGKRVTPAAKHDAGDEVYGERL